MYQLIRTDCGDKNSSIQQRQAGELEYLVFPKLEETGVVEHLFTTRTGGVSSGIYATMNLSFSRGDDPFGMLWRITDGLGKYSKRTRSIWWHPDRPILPIYTR